MDPRFITIDAPGFDRDADELVVVSFTAEEAISRLFRYEVDLVSKNLNIQCADFIGKNVTVAVSQSEGAPRHFNGYVNRLFAGGIIPGRDQKEMYRTYRAQIVPWLWFLTQTSDCRVFNRPPEGKLTIRSIIEQVLSECPHHDFTGRSMWGADERKMEYCVQYRETDFNFVSRLMEQFGIYYYFVHEAKSHTMVLSDTLGGYAEVADKQVDFAGTVGAHRRDHVLSWEHRFEFVSGRYAHTDYDFKDPSADLRRSSGNSKAKLTGHERYELFDYPGEYESLDDGVNEADVRIGEVEVRHDVVEGQSECRGFLPGHRFELVRHVAEEENGEYLLTSVVHAVSQPGPLATENEGLYYSNSFRCIPANTLFSPPRITERPVISGVQTALVVGPEGKEIYCDEYGRVRVRFHWEREGHERDKKMTPDDRCTCWIRVASQVAGNKWGFVGIPRIGQEVVVDFLEGDPDRPLIVGSVYNAEQMPHYELPENAAKTYIKTNSTPGGEGFNEIMFDDQTGSERLFLHAQMDKDEMVNGESRETIGGSKHQTIGSDRIERAGGDRLVQSGGHEAHKVGANFIVQSSKVLIKTGHEQRQVTGDRKLLIQGNNDTETTGELFHKIGGPVDVEVNSDYRLKASTVHVVSGEIALEAGSISLNCGGNFICIGPSGIEIVGSVVKINSGGAPLSAVPAVAVAVPTQTDIEDFEPSRAWTSKSGHKSSRD